MSEVWMGPPKAARTPSPCQQCGRLTDTGVIPEVVARLRTNRLAPVLVPLCPACLAAAKIAYIESLDPTPNRRDLIAWWQAWASREAAR